ncbi:hypothetical protein Zmor_025445 [Zophobas morio]|uniref:Uncharacterized protein n=1 Tax=Zophobas morio TaxID=2755281 RepID=A0AA38M4J9_9CUCU|nr:hypothetical protein Zmor_025445 [Zophobas morio]
MNPQKSHHHCHQCHYHCHQCHHHDHNPVPKVLGHYWRDYTGEIPEDAFPGGHDSNNKPIYIGQAFLKGGEMIPTSIYPGQAGMKLPCNWKANYSDIGMKILCSSNPDSLSWENVTASNLQSTTAGKQLVVGGFQDKNKFIVGRVKHEKELLVGKVLGYTNGSAKLHFVGGDKETSVDSYQVLIQSSTNNC